MGAQGNAAPVIIKRKKVVGGDGHHGGAWKVAYADFVTAMMAFFMLMWLLNATTEKQRKGIADYFSPTIPINRVSGGGDGAFGGDSIFSEMTLPKNGNGATSLRPTEADKARGNSGTRQNDGETATQDEQFSSLEAELMGFGGESAVMENELEHIITRITDEGLVVEIFATKDDPIFNEVTGLPTRLLTSISNLLVQTAKTVENDIAVGAHVPAQPVVRANIEVWDRSADQASHMRELLELAGLSATRIKRVTGHADREPVVRNPMAIRNNRLEVVFLRD